MPGLSFVYGFELKDEILDVLRIDNNIEVNKISESESKSVILSGFRGYPFFIQKKNDFTVCIEGLIYNLRDEEILKYIYKIAENFKDSDRLSNEINEFISIADGEFIVIILFNKTDDFIVLNDRWAHLPIYYFKGQDKIVISRDLKFVFKYLKKVEYDIFSLVEFLSIRYPLGNRTLFKHIKKMNAGDCIINRNGEIRVFKVLDFNFNCIESELKTKDEFAKKAAEILKKSTINNLEKIKDFKTKAVGVSGGYDTRIVVASVCKFSDEIVPVTLDLITGDESKVAKLVTDALGLNLQIIRADYDLSSSAVRNTYLKTNGFINARTTTACYQDLCQLMEQLEEPIAEFMGFGGEFLRHPLKKKRFHKTMVDVIKDDIFSNSLLHSICKCLCLNMKDLFAFWNDFFAREYQEQDMKDKVAHYYYDYYNFHVDQGIDRNRIKLWPVNPMYSNDWLYYSCKEVPRKLIGYELFEKIITEIDPKVSVDKILIWDKAFWRSKIFKFIQNNKIPSFLGKTYFNIKWRWSARNDKTKNMLIKEIEELYNTTECIQQIFDKNAIESFYKKEIGPYSRFLWQMYTLFLFMNKMRLD